ncbi:exo-alpha-sialidase [Dysgonomonas sp. 520]|uniref:exo-alpha-sialidase n=1 Tax=Dysgonomonas sp. 520 TaxID=2302931 RepID=UPI0013D4CA59|nr:exo-alpha-sialidase [Dysgonomonas sp. 520]NDW08563.1 exo-alpha-sialidase [Dysgonomonas sp. 520]
MKKAPVFFKYVAILFCIFIFHACKASTRQSIVLFNIEREVTYRSADTLFLQARSAFFPKNGKTEYMMTMSIYGHGTHAYGDIYEAYSKDGKKWSTPDVVENLKRHLTYDNLVRSFGDVTPEWHEKTKTVLCTGKTFFAYPQDTAGIKGNRRMDIEHLQEVAYAVFDPSENRWSGIKSVEFPDKLDNGDDFYCVNAGCTQRTDLKNGNVLLPIRYLKDRNYVSTVILCSYDGQEMKYLKHGTTFTVPQHRGLYEPSICNYKGEYFLTMRGDNSAYVAKSKDGLSYEPMKEWQFNDGEWLGSYNTQQHWVSNSKGLFLIYTRKGADNDNIFRHRAPLFIAQVDPANLTVLKETEQVLIPIPESEGDLGNFGVIHINDNETWVTVSVTPKDIRQTENIIAKIKWDN